MLRSHRHRSLAEEEFRSFLNLDFIWLFGFFLLTSVGKLLCQVVLKGGLSKSGIK